MNNRNGWSEFFHGIFVGAVWLSIFVLLFEFLDWLFQSGERTRQEDKANREKSAAQWRWAIKYARAKKRGDRAEVNRLMDESIEAERIRHEEFLEWMAKIKTRHRCRVRENFSEALSR